MSPVLAPSRYQNSAPWLMLAIGSLLLGGFLSLALVLGRAPIINQYFSDPLFAKRCLVVHVTLTLSCWFFAYIAALFHLIPGKKNHSIFIWTSIFGIVLFVVGGFSSSATPILSNYIPVIHQPLFLSGIAIFVGSIALSLFQFKIFKKTNLDYLDPNEILDFGSATGIRCSVLIYLISVAVLIFTILSTALDENVFSYYEIIFWGTGHLLQFANIAALISVWLILYKRMSGQALLKPLWAYVVFAGLSLPPLASLIFLIDGATGPKYYSGFTLLMRWGTWPSACLVLYFIFCKILTTKKPFADRELEFTGIIFSAFLLVLGFLLGSQIQESSTLIPAHYHATIGAVSLAFMTVSYILLEKIYPSAPVAFVTKWRQRQPIIFGTGQFTFSMGFAYAGIHGLGRKVYGQEQLLGQTEQYIGLGIMGIGGALAIAGGALFFVILYRAGYLKSLLKFRVSK